MRRPIAIAAVAVSVLVAGLALLDRAGGKGRGWPTSSLQALTRLTPVAGTVAPAFMLSDQRGRRVSLASLRGRVVVLESMDPECTLECPITSQEFVEAAHDLGRRSREVVFVGVNVNQYHARISDVLRFSTEHRLVQVPNWHFVTGSTSALRRVWRAYRIVVRPSRTGDVTHSDAMYFIDRRGLVRWVAAPGYNEAAIPQWGAAIADITNHLLAAGAVATPVAVASGSSSPRRLRAPHVLQAPALPGAQPISSRDRVYTADQASNTVTVIKPKTNQVLGTIPLGQDRLSQILGPVDTSEVGVHGLGFSRDGTLLDAISVNSNSVQLIRTRNNTIAHTTYTGRSPHEGFVSPDGRTVWVAVRGQNYVSVISTRTGRELQRITTANGPSKVVFSPDGTLAYVNHLRARAVEVIRVADRRIVKTIHGTAPESSDEAISPDGRELWLGHPFTGQETVIDAKRMRVITILNTGPRTNHTEFITKPDGQEYAYVTVGGLNETLVYRDHGGASPTLVTQIKDHGYGPHGIWPSPDNTRIYVGLQNSDEVDVINTATNTVIKTLGVGQDPMALVYVANAVPRGSGRQGLTRQGLNRSVENLSVQTQGVRGTASLTVRRLDDTDQLVFNGRGLPPKRNVTLSGVRPGGATIPLFTVTASASGDVDQALSYTDFIGVYPRAVLTPALPGAARIAIAPGVPLCGT